MSLRLESLTFRDIDGLLALSEAVDWDFTAEEWWTALKAGQVFGHRSDGENLISCAGIFPYGESFSVIGGVIVHPDQQGQGLGRELMEKILALMPDTDASVGLVATEAGARLYAKLGFQTTSYLWKAFADGPLQAPGQVAGVGLSDVLPSRDMSRLQDLDQACFGYPRGDFIKRRVSQAREKVFLYSDSGEMVGYALGVCRNNLMMVGPVAAPTAALAAHLVRAIASRHDGPLRIDISEQHETLIADITALGFRQVDRCPVMVRGKARPEAGWGRYFAMAAQAYL